MQLILLICAAAVAMITSAVSARAASTSVATVPAGYLAFSIPATSSGQNTTTYLSLPLTGKPVYSGSVASLTATSITVSDSPAPWTAGAFSTAAAPYFVKFLTGAEAGRVVAITANTTSTLSVDTTDDTLQTTALDTTSFTVAPGDTFQIVPGDTLGSIFGTKTAQSPLSLVGSSNPFMADNVNLYNPMSFSWQAYYFNTTAGYWELSGTTTNANNTIIYPFSGLSITRRSSEPAVSIIVTGRVAEVALLTKTTGSGAQSYGSTNYPVDMTLSGLKFGSNWTQSPSPYVADNVVIWNTTSFTFNSYYQLSDSTWRQSGFPGTDVSSLSLPAGSMVSIVKRAYVSGSTSYLQSVMPYSLLVD